ncbi:MAG: hypothetical protein KatS3mg043_0862 [Rhodothermaceae bacterium]|nr:MAG: hypothetical protein KatS3mg043_0862 [Rhodothermaceae bacterium]
MSMSKVFAIVGTVLAAFVIGFSAIFFAMPYVAPERYEKTQHMLDSLRAQRELRALGDSTLKVLEHHAIGILADSLGASVTRLDSILNRILRQHQTDLATLRDSLKMAHARLHGAEQTNTTLKNRLDELNTRVESLEAQRIEIRDLSAVLPKMENKELGPILAQLELPVLRLLFAESTARNRTKLLQALPPDRAARLVNFLVNDNAADTSRVPLPGMASPGSAAAPAGSS